MDRSAVILAGGFSERFGQDKAVLELKGKPLLRHVVDAIRPIVDEIIVVTNTPPRAEQYTKIVGQGVKFALDAEQAKGPLVGALAGFSAAQSTYAALLAADAPFVSREVVELLFDLCKGKTVAVPRWPNQQIEPLHAVYHVKSAIQAAQIALDEGKLNVRSMIENLGGVRYISTLVVQELDAELKTFFNVNTPVDLKMAETLANPRRIKATKRQPAFRK